MIKARFIFLVVFLFSAFAMVDSTAQNVAPPEWQQCTACHKLGEKLIGPNLLGVTERRTEEYMQLIT
jgi:cytochrome c2